MTRDAARLLPVLLLACGIWGACERARRPVSSGSSGAAAVVASAPATERPDELNHHIIAALQSGRYSDAIRLSRQAKVSEAERDFAVGEIILQGHSDDRPSQLPVESVEAGLRLVEAAALAGHQPAISSLAATFRTGLRTTKEAAFLVRPDEPLNRCWEGAKASPATAHSCGDLRRRR
jgi:hypothetical protein